MSSCGCERKYPVYSTDALRIHERFHDTSTNGEAFGEVVQVWERVLLIHLLRWFERRKVLDRISKVAFIVDGPLAMFGHPAWLSPLIKAELKRLNAIVRGSTGTDLLILGIEKTGAFVTHFEEIDRTVTGEAFFPKGSYALLTDKYIKERIIFSASDKPYGQDTYFGRKFFYNRTAMAFILIHLHGKVSDSLSNQMRQTKAMAPRYAVKWWKERDLKPPNLDPLEFFKKKLDWRYSKGVPWCQTSKVYLGDSTSVLPALRGDLSRRELGRASLLLTSPPYFGITNYHYDQWIRLWLLGGPPTDRRVGTRYSGKHRDKFAHAEAYRYLLGRVFKSAALLMKKDACIYVRTDWREPTLSITKATLKAAFPTHEFKRVNRPLIGETQTRLFGHYDPRFGEVDLVLRRR